MSFRSDNAGGAAPAILDALTRASRDAEGGYGGDTYTKRAERRLADLFEHEVAVFLMTTGGAANGLALSALLPSYGAVICGAAAHIEMDECGGVEFFTSGAKLIDAPAPGGKLTPDAVREALRFYPDDPATFVHRVAPKVLSLTQATEYGTAYTPAEIGALSEMACERGLRVHMDGARFANAVAGLGCAPADVTWRAGVDVLCLGATKNGALAAEAVIFFDPVLANDAAWRRKRAGHLWSKSRFLGAQIDAYLADDLWLRLARHSNAMARRLAEGLADIEGVDLPYPVEANEVFVLFPEALRQRLQAGGPHFYAWDYPGDPHGGRLDRLVCSFETTEEEVDAFIARARVS